MTTRDDLLKRISIDPQVCFGRPCIRGTRIWVSLIVDNLAEGVSESELRAAYPQLQPEEIEHRFAQIQRIRADHTQMRTKIGASLSDPRKSAESAFICVLFFHRP
jgi:uncharacterized protein (DUF433 family)